MKTREIRWFFKDPLPGVEQWISLLDSHRLTREHRTDSYLYIPSRDDLGIKIREGRLEFKYREDTPRPKRLSSGCEGYLETWIKYGFELVPGKPLSEILTGQDPAWCEVSKTRTALLIYQTHPTLEYGPLEFGNKTAVQLEYTRFEVLQQSWHTFGLEWPAAIDPDLPASFFEALLKGSRMSKAESMGYPAFLQQLAPVADS